MKLFNNFLENAKWLNMHVLAAILLMLLFLTSCQKDDINQNTISDINFFASSKPSKPPKIKYGKVRDIEGNVYTTVVIGTQTWMAENLKTTKFNDGTDIPYVSNNDEWSILTTPGYRWYNNDPNSNKDIYGALYNWYVGGNGSKNVCPSGWHMPT